MASRKPGVDAAPLTQPKAGGTVGSTKLAGLSRETQIIPKNNNPKGDGVMASADDNIPEKNIATTTKHPGCGVAGHIPPSGGNYDKNKTVTPGGTIHSRTADKPRADYDDTETYVPGFGDPTDRVQKMHKTLQDITPNLPN